MSWSIYATGTPKGVKEVVEKAETYGSVIGEKVKTLVAAVCDSIPAEKQEGTFVSVEGAGHDLIGATDGNDHTSGRATLEIRVGKMSK